MRTLYRTQEQFEQMCRDGVIEVLWEVTNNVREVRFTENNYRCYIQVN